MLGCPGNPSQLFLQRPITVSNNIKMVKGTSEKIYESYQEEIQKAYGCRIISEYGATESGIIAFEWLLKKLRIDDPVGAISVHGVCGALGTILVGVFAIDGGLLYGGGLTQLGVQALGVFAIGTWAIVTTFIVLFALKKTVGLRVSEKDETEGLDITEHAMNAYPDFRLNEK